VPGVNPQRRLAALAALVALACAGCASGSPQMGASSFRAEHGAAAVRVATAMKALEGELSRLGGDPRSTRPGPLDRAATEARRLLASASEWPVAGAGQEGAEEEDVPRAETQVTEAASELAGAMTALKAYTRAPSAAALTSLEQKLAPARQQWNEGISQLWYLAHASGAPTL
jgi:hypothetical protein